MTALTRSLFLLTALAATSCHDDDCECAAAQPSLVFIEVELFDPATNLVWEGVGVRIVEATLEWSGLTTRNPVPDDYRFTDETGTVLFDPVAIADAQVGFVEDALGRAVLEPDLNRDEALVLLEVFTPGSPTVLVDVPLSWAEPDVFISVPFTL